MKIFHILNGIQKMSITPLPRTSRRYPVFRFKQCRPSGKVAVRVEGIGWWQEGTDGIYLFNLFCQEDGDVGPMEKDLVYAPLSEVGDPAALAVGSEDQVLTIDSNGDAVWADASGGGSIDINDKKEPH